jgi:hypothetical protein
MIKWKDGYTKLEIQQFVPHKQLDTNLISNLGLKLIFQ